MVMSPSDNSVPHLQVIHQGGKTKLSVTGTAVMNISDYVAGCGYIPKTTKINVSGSAGAETDAVLVVSLKLLYNMYFVVMVCLHSLISTYLSMVSGYCELYGTLESIRMWRSDPSQTVFAMHQQ